jgi:HSP20 family protein
MASENQQSSASTSNQEQNRPSQQGSLARRPADSGMARRQQTGSPGFPLSPFEMISLAPFSLFRRIAGDLDRAFQPSSSSDESSRAVAFVPTIEVSEKDGTLRILADLPGMSPEDVQVEIDDDGLALSGERQVEQEMDEGGVRRTERQYGYFFRRIPLPDGVDPQQVKARFQDGVLEISMPAPNRQQERRQIPVEADSKSSGSASTGSKSSDAGKHAA